MIEDIYDLVTKRPMTRPEPLLPALLGFVLAILSLPLFALIWGVRGTDLTEFFARLLLQGFQDRRDPDRPQRACWCWWWCSPSATMSHGFARRAWVEPCLPKTRIDKGGQKAIISGTGYIGILSPRLSRSPPPGLICRGWRSWPVPCPSGSASGCRTSYRISFPG